MIYNLSNELHRENFKSRVNSLFKQKKIVELSEKKPVRTIRQNRYLHLLLSFFACQTGNTMEWVKQKYFKVLCNKDIFVRERDDEYMGNVQYVRSSADLTTDELTLAIERFRNWSSESAGIYLPSPNEEDLLTLMDAEVEMNKKYI